MGKCTLIVSNRQRQQQVQDTHIRNSAAGKIDGIAVGTIGTLRCDNKHAHKSAK